MGAICTVVLGAGALASAAGRVAPAAFATGAVGCSLAAASSVAGFAALARARVGNARAFAAALVGLFLGRVALVGLYGLALRVIAPAHVALGLVALAGFHFVFTVLEIRLLARPRDVRRGAGQRA
ncbi:MAG: hypothetical protein ABR599_09640 [Gemmatimonadota bacterium]